MERFLGIRTGLNDWKFYLAGAVAFAVAYGASKYYPGLPHWIREIKGYGIYAIPFMSGFIMSKYFNTKLMPFWWGYFLSAACLFRTIGTGHESPFSKFFDGIAMGVASLVIIGFGVVVEMACSAVWRRVR